MKTLRRFVGINNVAQAEEHGDGELSAAVNVDLSSKGAIVSRRGHTELLAGACIHSPYKTDFGLLCVVGGELLALQDDGTEIATIHGSIGPARLWYATLPDGRIAFSNGLIRGLCSADGTAGAEWGVPIPSVAADAPEGDLPYWLTYRRISDGLEGGAFYAGKVPDVSTPLRALPILAGYTIRVYFALDGLTGFLAGSTLTDEFTFSGARDELLLPCVTEHMIQPPPGRCLNLWRTRVLMATGRVLWATSPLQYEHTDARRDFLQVADDITFVHGVDAGIWVGTTKALLFLRGQSFGELTLDTVFSEGVTLGSGAAADFGLMASDARPSGEGAFCLVGGKVAALGSGGQALLYAATQYRAAEMDEATATTRVRDGVLQYLVSPVS